MSIIKSLLLLLLLAAFCESAEPKLIENSVARPNQFELERPPHDDLRLVTATEEVTSDEQPIDFGSLGSNVQSMLDRFRFNGQIRVRQETDFERIGRPTRNRQRLRLRLGATTN